jgi:hypothetical protein
MHKAHNLKVGGSNPPPATRLSIGFIRLIINNPHAKNVQICVFFASVGRIFATFMTRYLQIASKASFAPKISRMVWSVKTSSSATDIGNTSSAQEQSFFTLIL